MQWLSFDCFITCGTSFHAVPAHHAEAFSSRHDLVFQKNNPKESKACGITLGGATGLLRSIGCNLRIMAHHGFRLGESCPEKFVFMCELIMI